MKPTVGMDARGREVAPVLPRAVGRGRPALEGMSQESLRRALRHGGFVRRSLVPVLAPLAMPVVILMLYFRAGALTWLGSAPLLLMSASVLYELFGTDRWQAQGRPQQMLAAMVLEGRCGGCAYQIGDLPVEADGCVVCPECGAAWRFPEEPCRVCGAETKGLAPLLEDGAQRVPCLACGSNVRVIGGEGRPRAVLRVMARPEVVDARGMRVALPVGSGWAGVGNLFFGLRVVPKTVEGERLAAARREAGLGPILWLVAGAMWVGAAAALVGIGGVFLRPLVDSGPMVMLFAGSAFWWFGVVWVAERAINGRTEAVARAMVGMGVCAGCARELPRAGPGEDGVWGCRCGAGWRTSGE